MNISFGKISLSVLFCFAVWAGGLAVRRAVLSQQTRSLGEKEAPFLMESALQFRMTQMVKDTGTLPVIDEKVQVPDGVVMRETYTVGAEWIYTFLSSLLPQDGSFTSRVRWVSTALFCLAIPFAGLWARTLTGSLWAGWITAGILIASPSFAVRSSGLELSRENLAIPLFTLFLWLQSRAASSEHRVDRIASALMGGLALAAAQCVWDLTQVVTGLWIVWCWVRVFRDPEKARKDDLMVGCVAAALIVASLWNPYLRSHGTIFSPVIAVVVARLIGCIQTPLFTNRRTQAALLMGILSASLLYGTLFTENYSHFGELLTAKIVHGNVKPMDPSVLTYLQRIMWTPALNSTTWELTKAYFLFTLIIYCVVLARFALGKRRAGTATGFVLFSSLFLLPVTILFFRFHVFWVLFAAVAIGAGCSLIVQKGSRFRCQVLPALLFLFITGGECYLLLFFEPSSSSNLPSEREEFFQLVKAMGGDITRAQGNRWGRPGASYGALKNLSEQLETLPDPGPVLANFGISGSILAHTGLPILLHPKFETPGIRERVRGYYEHLFLGTEESLRTWAVDHESRYYVHSNGNLSDVDIRNSPRYMVDAVEPPDHAPVYLFENRPQDLTYFRPVGGNERYRIFRIVLPEDEQFAETFTDMARRSLNRGDLETAERRARQALSYHWKYRPAQELLATLLSL